MRVLLFHNRYRQPGGEDLSAAQEAEVLRAGGVEVIRVEYDNDLRGSTGFLEQLRLGLNSAWSRASYQHALELCERHRPDVAHVQNFWMRLTPAVHGACHRAGVPTVQALRNYRLVCTNALLLREGRICEDCLGKLPWRGVVRRCYRDSLPASAAVARMILHNRRRRTWECDVDAFLAPSGHLRERLVRAGLPAERVFVKPNCVEAPAEPCPPPSASHAIVYVGRLSREKGLEELLSVWSRARLGRYGRLLIVGEGKERSDLERRASALGLKDCEIRFVGRKSREETQALVCQARALVLPSLAYESFGRTVVEAFAAGRPAVVSDAGAPGEIVTHGKTGLTFPHGDTAALGRALETVLTNPQLADRLGAQAARDYRANYTPQRNFEILMRTYRYVIERRRRPVPAKLETFQPAEEAV